MLGHRAPGPPGVAIAVAAHAKAEAERRRSLQSTAFCSEPNTGVRRRAQFDTLRSQPSIWKAAAPASGSQNEGLDTALTAEAAARCHPGRTVASSPQAWASGSVEQAVSPAAESAATSAARRIA